MLHLKMLTEKEMQEIRSEMYKKAALVDEYLRENRIFASVYVGLEHNEICVEINWGDWKHDHLCADWLIEEKFHATNAWKEITEENGSDCFSAIHHYYFF